MCEHHNFEADVQVTRLEDQGRPEIIRGYQADVRIKCVDCGLPFRFLGLPHGLDFAGAAVSFDGTEARLAIAPKKTETERG